MNLQEVARGATHQLAGLSVVVKGDVQTKDVREELLAQLCFGEPTLSEGEPAPPRGERARDHRHRSDEERPEQQRAVPQHRSVDRETGQLGDRHLSCTPQQADCDAGQQPNALLAQHRPQETPTTGPWRLQFVRLGPFPHASGHYAGGCPDLELNSNWTHS